MHIFRIDRGYRNIKRYRQIIAVLFKYGFSEVLDRIHLAPGLGRRLLRGEVSVDTKISYAIRLRMALEELGPTFIKLGQILSMRSFLISPDLAAELSKLQDEVSPVGFGEMQPFIEKELQQPIDQCFRSFDLKPVASASLAQAYRAVTKSGKEVIVKVQRPGIQKVIDADMAILMDIAGLLEKYISDMKQYDPTGTVRELARVTRRELNFENEARNIELFAKNFANWKKIYVPKVFWDLTTSKVLTLERIAGIKISDLEQIERTGLDRRIIARIGGLSVLKQIFEDGFFHADPHPGNLFVLTGNIIAPVDYGMMGQLDEEDMDKISNLFIALVRKDVNGIVRAFMNMGMIDEETDVRGFRLEIAGFVNSYYGMPLGKIDMKEILEELFDVMRRYRIKVQSELLLLNKAMGTYEEVARLLDPNFDFITLARPYIKRLVRRKMDPRREIRNVQKLSQDFRALVRILPSELEAILKKANRGNLVLQLQLRGLEKFISEMDRASNRLALSFMLAALVVSSSIIMHMNRGPLFLGYPILGIVGFLFAGILGIWLIVAILRSGML